MPQVTLCMERSGDMAKIEEAVRALSFMMPRIDLRYVVAADGLTVRFLCESADTLTLSSAVQMLKSMLGHYGKLTHE